MSPLPTFDPSARRQAAVLVAALLAVLVVGAVLAFSPEAPPTQPAEGAAAAAPEGVPVATVPEGPFTLAVDPSVQPAIAVIEGLDEGDEPRPVGRILDADGTEMDVVLDELVVVTESQAQFDAFVERWDAEVVHSYEPEPDGSQDHLVRIDGTAVVDVADPAVLAEVAAGLVEMEPYHAGEMALGDESLVGLLAVLAHETNEGGPVVSPNFVAESAGIPDRSMIESNDQADAWTWSYLRDGGALDYGVTGAWELLSDAERLDRRVNVLIFDGGFVQHDDVPLDPTLRLAQWGEPNSKGCSGGNACPWHGTDVAVTAIGVGDNGFGTVGPGGPVGRLIAVDRAGDVYGQLRDLVEMVDIEFANIVNLSYGWSTTLAQAGHRYSFDRRLTKIDDRALVVAAAGNDGMDVDAEKCDAVRCWERTLHMPCESSHVLCVGGLERSAAQRDGGSNYGTDTGSETVELYGPMGVVTPELDDSTGEPTGATVWTRGTSVASPFVAGVAALMESATSFQITPGELQDLLVRTANHGDLGPEVTGHERWVNARAAALELLGIEAERPTIAITSHEDGDEIVAGEFYALTATATDFLGRALPVTWTSSVDGELGTVPAGQNIGPDLSLGAHTLTATATDFLGATAITDIEVVVVDNPPLLTIGAPIDGSQFFVGQSIPLTGLGVDPDTWIALSDQEVEWEISKAGTVLGTWNGLVGQVETGVWGAGNYLITFRTVDGIVSESVLVQVVVPPPGTPVVSIDSPANGIEVGASAFGLSGSAHVDGAPVSGTRFRWTATAGDTVVDLCTGSSFHGPAPGSEPGLAAPTTPVDCSDTEAALSFVNVGESLSSTVWTIRLEVRGQGGQIGWDEIAVTFILMIP